LINNLLFVYYKMRSRKIHRHKGHKSHKKIDKRYKSHKGYKGDKNKSGKRTRRQRHYYVPVFTNKNDSDVVDESGMIYKPDSDSDKEKEKGKNNSGNIIKGMRDFLNKKRGFVL